ncbi:MAG: ferrous iron transport protein A [Candidatus Omnitrophica bacterium]|nr:ferrous iron transport protein A [Candidatus Omnitrophota bacterium]MDE2010039.1 ferrous iron transport protein A [Candidatus Omnitrophota bacterium]MDE2214726.1 ferrous iron transport protein A [Candidatus Omnitrophota bacterium]MDE2231791.1 ferrous iron transport protein A [Candidatus Omnitrophota bacterium]
MPDAKDDKQWMILSKVPVGQKALIVAFSVETDRGERIQEMGLVPGEVVEVVRVQAGRIEVKIGRYFVALRAAQAGHIRVKLLS